MCQAWGVGEHLSGKTAFTWWGCCSKEEGTLIEAGGRCVVQMLSNVWHFATPWTATHQASLSFTVSRSLLKFMSIEFSNPITIPSFATLFFFCFQSFPASVSFPMNQLVASGGQSVGVLPMNIQSWFPLGLTGWSPCSPRDSQEYSPTPQFKCINSSVFSLLYGPTLTSIYDCWENHRFDYMDLRWTSNVFAF